MLIDVLSLFLLIFTSLIGVATLLKYLFLKLFDRKKMDKAVSVLPVKGHEDAIEYILRGLLADQSKKVIVVDFGIAPETKKIVEQLADRNGNLSLLAEGKVLSYLSKEVMEI